MSPHISINVSSGKIVQQALETLIYWATVGGQCANWNSGAVGKSAIF